MELGPEDVSLLYVLPHSPRRLAREVEHDRDDNDQRNDNEATGNTNGKSDCEVVICVLAASSWCSGIGRVCECTNGHQHS